MSDNARKTRLFDWAIVRPAIADSFCKLSPRRQFRNPVMFVVLVGSVLTTLLFVQALVGKGEAGPWFILGVSLWLWFTVLFANFAEAMAEGHGRAQADSLRKAQGPCCQETFLASSGRFIRNDSSVFAGKGGCGSR